MESPLLSSDVQAFIQENLNRQASDILLKSSVFSKEFLKEIVIQIQSKQKAKNKLPTWLKTDKVLFPKPLAIEQSSSEKTANWKAGQFSGKHLIDLTGGFGVDSFFLLKILKKFITLNHSQIYSR